MEEGPLKKFIIYNIERVITRVFKAHLNNLHELNQKNLEALHLYKNELKDPLMIKYFSFLDGEEFSRYRKKTLDEGNESLREIRQMLDKIDFNLTEEERVKMAKGSDKQD